MEIAEAVEEARRARGMVMLTAEDDPGRWCAVCVAVDGSLELRVGGGKKRRLRAQGFRRIPDAWALPVPATTSDVECAATLAEALELEPGTPLRRELAHLGSASGELPPPDAPRAEHLAAALRDLALAGGGRVDVWGGRPSRLWAIVWAFPDERELQVESELGGEDVWREPLSLDGAAAGARELALRAEGEEGPLYLEYLPPHN
jgi:hypothetical protein